MATELEHLDIYYSAQISQFAGAEIELLKINLPKLKFLQLANVVINERGVARLEERIQKRELKLVGMYYKCSMNLVTK